MYQRPIAKEIIKRITEKRKFIQVLTGPRQSGKTTIARQIAEALDIPHHFASTDESELKDRSWIEQQWETARLHIENKKLLGLLILDEIQKIPYWSDVIKRLWDEDSALYRNLHVMILGSSPLLMQRGLSESLAGRFEITHIPHWSYTEMKEAFNWNAEDYIYYGGYPGSASLINDHHRWSNYIVESIIEPTISRDILLMTRIDKPALLKRLFELGSAYSGRILSYQKILGQLQDAGNTTTLAHYLQVLEGAGLLAGLQKYAGQRVRQRGSSPKFQILNTALASAQRNMTKEEAKKDPAIWGRLTESAVGASLYNGIRGKGIELFYWSGYNHEIDFILCRGNTVTAIEVKSGRKKDHVPGMELFSKEFKVNRKLLIGKQGISFDDFFSRSAESWA